MLKFTYASHSEQTRFDTEPQGYTVEDPVFRNWPFCSLGCFLDCQWDTTNLIQSWDYFFFNL